jgi:hypothetical protein
MSVTTHPAGIFWGKSEQHFAISGEKNRAGGEKSRQYGGGMTGEVSRAIQGDFVRKVVECFGRKWVHVNLSKMLYQSNCHCNE